MAEILAFTTGSPNEPPLGFDPLPHLEFVGDEGKSPLPKANTCTNTLYLPVVNDNLDRFSYFMASGILNTAGFGLV